MLKVLETRQPQLKPFRKLKGEHKPPDGQDTHIERVLLKQGLFDIATSYRQWSHLWDQTKPKGVWLRVAQ